MRVIENVNCLPLVRFGNSLYRIIGKRYGHRAGSSETWGLYYDLALHTLTLPKYPDHINVHESLITHCVVEPDEQEAVGVSCNGSAQLLSLAVNNQ